MTFLSTPRDTSLGSSGVLCKSMQQNHKRAVGTIIILREVETLLQKTCIEVPQK
jgi:hypothetical protein